jgi:hypothetical protein
VNDLLEKHGGLQGVVSEFEKTCCRKLSNRLTADGTIPKG